MVADKGTYQITVQHPDPIEVPCGPLTTSGLINHANYRVSCRHLPMGLPITVITEAMNSRYKLIDVEVENWTSPNRRHVPMAYGGITMYVRCQDKEEALNMPEYIEVAGHQIKLWHAGLKKCEE